MDGGQGDRRLELLPTNDKDLIRRYRLIFDSIVKSLVDISKSMRELAE